MIGETSRTRVKSGVNENDVLLFGSGIEEVARHREGILLVTSLASVQSLKKCPELFVVLVRKK